MSEIKLNHLNIRGIYEGMFVSETGKYIVSFFFDDKGLQLSLLN